MRDNNTTLQRMIRTALRTKQNSLINNNGNIVKIVVLKQCFYSCMVVFDKKTISVHCTEF